MRLAAFALLILAPFFQPILNAESNPWEESAEYNPTALEGWPEATFATREQRLKALRPGERFAYRARWGLFRKAGSMSIETEASEIDGELLLKTHTASRGLIRAIYPVDLYATALFDQERRMRQNDVEGKTRSETTLSSAIYDYEKMELAYTDHGDEQRSKTASLPYDAPLDYSSAFLMARSYELNTGLRFPLCVASKGKVYYVEMEVGPIDRIKTPWGKRDAYRISPINAFPQSRIFREGGGFSMWFSADEEQIPLRIDVKTKAGNASLLIESYQLASGVQRD